jgi:hypothetical protein
LRYSENLRHEKTRAPEAVTGLVSRREVEEEKAGILPAFFPFLLIQSLRVRRYSPAFLNDSLHGANSVLHCINHPGHAPGSPSAFSLN